MSGSGLLSAMAVGVTVGVLGRLVVPGPKAAPVGLTVALGVAAAQLGSITASLIGVGTVEPNAWIPRSVAQVSFAVAAVVLAVVATGRRRPYEEPGARVDPEEKRAGGRPGSGRTLRGPA
ncbi:hypothetical protein NLX85_17100 [Micromonospora sp. A3M-1-15]|uniref:hypothetical protein n=1 Tax=Micromonospora sp. A3M-1-15 TaxID=2962035 RepID=UPI0020B67047|nr:hypothetical protein [Micromonospora sp. A3M-1-15]MCP3785088.1 hypothetical protein [Micromonospora sp. A3M-1-15]